MDKATEGQLNSLHGALANALADRIANGETTTRGDSVTTSPAPAAVLNVARGFLADNKIECVSGEPSGPIEKLDRVMEETSLDESLPDFPSEVN